MSPLQTALTRLTVGSLKPHQIDWLKRHLPEPSACYAAGDDALEVYHLVRELDGAHVVILVRSSSSGVTGSVDLLGPPQERSSAWDAASRRYRALIGECPLERADRADAHQHIMRLHGLASSKDASARKLSQIADMLGEMAITERTAHLSLCARRWRGEP